MSSAVKALFVKRSGDQWENASEYESPCTRSFNRASGSASSSATARTIARQPHYKVDLAMQMAECEANYVRLLKMLPDLHDTDRWQFAIGGEFSHVDVCITVIDRAPYTTTLLLTQSTLAAIASKVPNLKAPTLTICLYHDADMAEVVAWENHRRFRPRYNYPNSNMYHCDEKAQCNRFLSDWLTLCLAQGRSVVDMDEMGIMK